MATIYKESPAIAVQVQALRSIQETFEFDRDGQHVSFTRRALQCVYDDACGKPTIGTSIPERDWSLDLTPLEGRKVILYVSRFETSKQGVCVFRFCGYDFADKSAK